ncbi:MAG: fluoride efflux transporter CrcB [Hyphomicrobiales bacterium]|jgi:CrcB protein
MPMIVWIAVGGALGSVARYFVNVWAGRLLGPDFPYGTLTVNIVGSFVMGFLIAMMALKVQVSQEVRAFLTTGILGGFTTFSAFSLDFATLVERRSFELAGVYLVASVGVSLLAIFAGLKAGRMLFS